MGLKCSINNPGTPGNSSTLDLHSPRIDTRSNRCVVPPIQKPCPLTDDKPLCAYLVAMIMNHDLSAVSKAKSGCQENVVLEAKWCSRHWYAAFTCWVRTLMVSPSAFSWYAVHQSWQIWPLDMTHIDICGMHDMCLEVKLGINQELT